MEHYRKKPVVIQAEQYKAFRTLSSEFSASVPDGTMRYTETGTLLIATLEGVMEAKDGDWIIRGVNGEFYPCKPEIFAKTYEPASPVTKSDVLTGDGVPIRIGNRVWFNDDLKTPVSTEWAEVSKISGDEISFRPLQRVTWMLAQLCYSTKKAAEAALAAGGAE